MSSWPHRPTWSEVLGRFDPNTIVLITCIAFPADRLSASVVSFSAGFVFPFQHLALSVELNLLALSLRGNQRLVAGLIALGNLFDLIHLAAGMLLLDRGADGNGCFGERNHFLVADELSVLIHGDIV